MSTRMAGGVAFLLLGGVGAEADAPAAVKGGAPSRTPTSSSKENAMPKPSVDELMAADSGLNRSLAACVAVFLSGIGLLFMVSRSDKDVPWARTAGFVLVALLLASYVWYAICCGRAAKVLGEPGWKYALWIVAAPLVAPLPSLVAELLNLPAPGLISTAIAISPLSIKFLLGRQLDEAIRQKAFED